jgi:hypothetical protein
MLNLMRLVTVLALMFGVSSCNSQSEKARLEDQLKGTAQEVSEPAPSFAPAKKLGKLKNKKLDEVSGLAASVANPGLFWVLNDSGNKPEIYLIDEETNIVQTYALKGVRNRDWEEIAVGPGPETGKQYIYVGEIGDNMAIHPYKYIYRFPEPVYASDEDKETIDVTRFDTITFALSDERRDTEAFVVDPVTRDIYVIAKWKSPVDVYQLRFSDLAKNPAIAEHVGTLPISTVVAADFSRDGTELLIKNYDKIFYWKRPVNTPVMKMLQKVAVEIPYEREPQGESIAWSADGDGFYTVSEQKKNEDVHLLYYRRQ